MHEELHQLLDKLRLPGIAEVIDEVLIQAEQKGTAIQEVLLELLEAEYRDKSQRALNNRVKRAQLPWPWTLDTFPFKDQPNVNKTQIMGLAKLDFIKRSENLIFIGSPGTGKSGLAMGILRSALLNGYRGRFCNAQELLDELYASLADRSTSSVLKVLCNYDVLVIDELGYLTLTPEKVNIFFKLVDMRYRKKTTIITTNLKFEDWYAVFKQKELVDAMLDRFRHYCTTIHINGPSLREPIEMVQTKSKKSGSKKADSLSLDEA
jgi:DNA replication protein DnaC